MRAGERYHEGRGNHLAAAIAFFSVLNAVPLLMIAFAATGYALVFNPSLLAALEAAVARAVPTELSDTVAPVIDAAIAQRNTVAGVGLLAALWAGTWWMFNLREAVSAQWAIPPQSLASPRRLLSDLVALAGLWTAVIGSLAISAIGTGVGESLLRLVGWQGAVWTETTRISLGLVLGLAADWLIFLWIITRLPRTRDPVRGAARAALLGAIGLEVLKQGLAIYLGGITGSVGGTVFGSLLGVLVFAYLVSRFVLLVTAWAATMRLDDRPRAGGSEPGPPLPRPRPSLDGRSGRERLLIVLGGATADQQSKRREAARQEILSAAWDVARERGLAALTLREVAARLGMRAPLLYPHFASKHAIFDAMYGQAWAEYDRLAEDSTGSLPDEPRGVLRAIARRHFDFATADLPRHQLMDLRTIPGFTPSDGTRAHAVRVYDRLRTVMASIGVAADADLDLFVALIGGLADSQWANDPGGDRYARLLDRAVDMYADALRLPQEEP